MTVSLTEKSALARPADEFAQFCASLIASVQPDSTFAERALGVRRVMK